MSWYPAPESDDEREERLRPEPTPPAQAPAAPSVGEPVAQWQTSASGEGGWMNIDADEVEFCRDKRGYKVRALVLATPPAAPAATEAPSKPLAYYIHIAAEQRGEFVHDLDEALDDLTNCDCKITELFDRATPAPAVVASVQPVPNDDAPPCWWIDHGSHGQITQREDEARRAADEGKRVVSYAATPVQPVLASLSDAIDGPRYRWLRANREAQAEDGTLLDVYDEDGTMLSHESLDRAIDAALASSTPVTGVVFEPVAAPAPASEWLKCEGCGRDMRGHDRMGHCLPAVGASVQPVLASLTELRASFGPLAIDQVWTKEHSTTYPQRAADIINAATQLLASSTPTKGGEAS